MSNSFKVGHEEDLGASADPKFCMSQPCDMAIFKVQVI